jgi:hypothetical protein
MAHFAELDKDNIVISVHVVANHVITDSDGNDDEQKGIEFLQGIFGESTVWKQTSYNRTFRKNYAGRGMTYDKERDAFISLDPPYPSWVFNETVSRWEAPTPYPDNSEDFKRYRWDESSTSWKEDVA